MTERATTGDRPQVFPVTQWTVVLAAGGTPSPESARALERLCTTYCYPLYAFVRRSGYSPPDAEDLTQEFFARLLEHNWIARADRRKGRFRSFLLMAMKRFLAKEWDKAKALKRGGDVQVVPLESGAAETRYAQEILGFVGQGGMGAVYKARQKALDRVVALKLLPPGIGKEPAFAERFMREARTLARLNHPGIVTIYEFGQQSGLFFFLMEFVDGANLREMLQAGHLPPERAFAIVPMICDALQFAHDEGIMHRDIKPENVLIDKKGRVKIADFGLAKLLGQEPAGRAITSTGMGMGTPKYVAPEQIENAKAVDHRADIYSLGVVFYEMLTGELPLGGFAPPSQKVQVDVRLDEVVLKSLEKDPARRYQHAGGGEVGRRVHRRPGCAGGLERRVRSGVRRVSGPRLESQARKGI